MVMDARPHRRYCECRNDFGVPITAGARVDDCAHDNAHRHGRRLRRLRERTAGQQHRGLQRLLFSRTIIATAGCLTGSRPEGCGIRLSTARQRRPGLGLATRRCAAERPAWSGGRRQPQFGLHLCHTQLDAARLAGTIRLVCMQPMQRMHAGRADRHSLPADSATALALDATKTSGRAAGGAHDHESWACACASAISDLPFLQAKWS